MKSVSGTRGGRHGLEARMCKQGVSISTSAKRRLHALVIRKLFNSFIVVLFNHYVIRIKLILNYPMPSIIVMIDPQTVTNRDGHLRTVTVNLC